MNCKQTLQCSRGALEGAPSLQLYSKEGFRETDNAQPCTSSSWGGRGEVLDSECLLHMLCVWVDSGGAPQIALALTLLCLLLWKPQRVPTPSPFPPTPPAQLFRNLVCD